MSPVSHRGLDQGRSVDIPLLSVADSRRTSNAYYNNPANEEVKQKLSIIAVASVSGSGGKFGNHKNRIPSSLLSSRLRGMPKSSNFILFYFILFYLVTLRLAKTATCNDGDKITKLYCLYVHEMLIRNMLGGPEHCKHTIST